MDLEFRTVASEEFARYVRTLETAFSGSVSESEMELYLKVAEFDRMLVAVVQRNDEVGRRTVPPAGE